MPKGSLRKGYPTKQRLHNELALSRSPVGQKRKAKAVNEWNELRAAGVETAGHATKSLRKSMREVRAEPGGSLSSIRENPVKALKRRAAAKKK